MKMFIRSTVRPIGLSILTPGAGFLLILLFEIIFDAEISRLISSIFNLVVASLLAFTVFPKILGIPFGKTDTRKWVKQLGLYFPQNAWKHILLGIILAGCTLSGMLVASILTGKYSLDWSRLNLPHLVFSLNPAIWEELFYRGVIMIVLLRTTGSVKRAAIIQITIFGLLHIKGIDLWDFVDTLTVVILALGFTFAAYKTNALITGIIFHYLHDALLFLVQLPDGVSKGAAENILFYAILWSMVALGCAIIHLAADKLQIRATTKLYAVKKGSTCISNQTSPLKPEENTLPGWEPRHKSP
jgi:membrane protease YdiL (CAAX protease family)